VVITQKFLSLGKTARGDVNDTNKPLYFTKRLEYIIIHWIGPYPGHSPAGVMSWWENGGDGRGVRASAHFIVKENEVLQCLPLDEIGWHSGDTRNYSAIGIEVVPMNTAGEFSETTQKTLKELVNFIRQQTGINLKLERHFDGIQKKDCPRFYTPVVSLLDGGGRVANPEGGQERWERLVEYLNETSKS